MSEQQPVGLGAVAIGSGKMHARIKEMMKQLVDAPLASLLFKVSELAKRRWMAWSDDGPIVQLELVDNNKRWLIFRSRRAMAVSLRGRSYLPCLFLRIQLPRRKSRLAPVQARL